MRLIDAGCHPAGAKLLICRRVATFGRPLDCSISDQPVNKHRSSFQHGTILRWMHAVQAFPHMRFRLRDMTLPTRHVCEVGQRVCRHALGFKKQSFATFIVGFILDEPRKTEHNENMERRFAPMTLREPTCEVGCSTCLMSCAILPARLAWWQGEIERLYRERSMRKAYPEARDQLETALAAHEALARKFAASPRSSCRVSVPRQ